MQKHSKSAVQGGVVIPWSAADQGMSRLLNAFGMGKRLTALGCTWDIRHIYREFNRLADRLAGECVRTPWRAGGSPGW